MKLQKYEYRSVTELTEVELTEELAQECERVLKLRAVNPEEVPHISMQTIAQCWADNVCNEELENYTILIKGHSGAWEVKLVNEINDWLQGMMWTATETQSKVIDSHMDDWSDDFECSPEEYQTMIRVTNPDFLSDDDADDVSPETTNDNH